MLAKSRFFEFQKIVYVYHFVDVHRIVFSILLWSIRTLWEGNVFQRHGAIKIFTAMASVALLGT